MELDDEGFGILSCNISKRPATAPGLAELIHFVCDVRRANDCVDISFDPAAEKIVESFVEAERRCCTGLNWELQWNNNGLQLRITGTAEQAMVIERWFTTE